MNSRSSDRSWRNGRSEPERVFLVGVEFLSRALTNRDKQKHAAEGGEQGVVEASESHPRQQPLGKVPASARAARTVVDAHIHAADHEHRSFSSEESMDELKGAVASVAPDLVIFDHELTPSQQRNLERALDVRVVDRTQLILDIFARHARTREG